MLVILKHQQVLTNHKKGKKNTMPPMALTNLLFQNFIPLDLELLKYKYLPRSNSTFRCHYPVIYILLSYCYLILASFLTFYIKVFPNLPMQFHSKSLFVIYKFNLQFNVSKEKCNVINGHQIPRLSLLPNKKACDTIQLYNQNEY